MPLCPDELRQDDGKAAIGTRIGILSEQDRVAGNHAAGVRDKRWERLRVGA